MAGEAAKLITVAQVGAVSGVKGELKLHVFAEQPASVLHYKNWYIQRNKAWLPIKDIEIRAHGEGFLIRLERCCDRDIAKKYTNALLAVSRQEFPDLPEGEYYWVDLEGLNVFTTAGHELGRIDHLFSTGSNDVVVVKGEKEHLLPYSWDVIQSIDLAAGKMVVEWDVEF